MGMTLKEIDEFTKKYPDLGNFIAELNGTYNKCQVDKVLDTKKHSVNIGLEEKYKHIYVTDGGCRLCKDRMKMFIDHRREIMDKAHAEYLKQKRR